MSGVSTDMQERIARNEATFRRINEDIERGRDCDDDTTLVGFVCECGSVDCGRLIELLARSNVLLDKLLFASQVGPGLRKSRVVLRKLCLVTSNQCLDLAIIQGEQKITLLDDLAVTDMLLEHLAFDA